MSSINYKTLFNFALTSPEDTVLLGMTVGKALFGGEIIELTSDIGGGKTTFIKGLAKGVGSNDMVTSPTFTVAKQYKGKKLTLHHFDFYRLNDPGVVGSELQELLDDNEAVLAIEWSDIAKPLFSDRAVVRVRIDQVANDQYGRQITIQIPQENTQLVDALEGYA